MNQAITRRKTAMKENGVTNIPMKEAAKRVIDSLPEDATLEEIIHALYVQAKFSCGEEQIRAGQGVPHDLARQKLGKWVK